MATLHQERNLPRPTPETEHYWQGCREGELRIQRCTDCGLHQFYPRFICGNCLGDQVEWVTASGRGELVSYTVIRRAVSDAYAADVPYVVGLVKLIEGPTMMSSLVDCDIESVAVGMSVEVVFEEWSEEITMPRFRILSA
jgi:uncharacterized OB-fold protein